MPKKSELKNKTLYQLKVQAILPEIEWFLMEGTPSQIVERAKAIISGYRDGVTVDSRDSEPLVFQLNKKHDPESDDEFWLGAWHTPSNSEEEVAVIRARTTH